MIQIVLVEPEEEGNVGAIARVLANFNISKLVLVNPKCEHLGVDALIRSKHAEKILRNAVVVKDLDSIKTDYLVGTTSLLGTDYNVSRIPMNPEMFAEKIKNVKKKVSIVFGREGDGLTNEEIRKCDFTVTIPTSTKYKAMNLSHSVAIVLYEIFKKSKDEKTGEGYRLASGKDKQILLKTIDKVLDNLKFATNDKKETQKRVWKRIIGKAFVTKREFNSLIGFFKKLI